MSNLFNLMYFHFIQTDHKQDTSFPPKSIYQMKLTHPHLFILKKEATNLFSHFIQYKDSMAFDATCAYSALSLPNLHPLYYGRAPLHLLLAYHLGYTSFSRSQQ